MVLKETYEFLRRTSIPHNKKRPCNAIITRTGSSPIAEDGVKRIGELYKIEAELLGLNPEARLAVRQVQSKALIIDMQAWLAHQRARVSAKAPLGEALKYIVKYGTACACFCLTVAWNWITTASNVRSGQLH